MVRVPAKPLSQPAAEGRDDDSCATSTSASVSDARTLTGSDLAVAMPHILDLPRFPTTLATIKWVRIKPSWWSWIELTQSICPSRFGSSALAAPLNGTMVVGH